MLLCYSELQKKADTRVDAELEADVGSLAPRRRPSLRVAALALLAAALPAAGQKIPDVRCQVEDYPFKSVTAWQFPQTVGKVQVVVLRDPAGQQEARFDLLHGATLISLRYRGKELLYGQSAGAAVALFATRRGAEAELKEVTPYWSAYNPDQGGASMGVPATTAGVACSGQSSMRAFAMMNDRGVNNSFQKEPLLGVWQGRISDNFPPGYSTPYVIETNASWVENPGGAPRYYLKLDQSVVNVRPGASGPLDWFLTAAAPWDFEHAAAFPETCTGKTPCTSAQTGALATGRYADAARTTGFATVVPTADWRTGSAYLLDNAEYVVLLYGAVWAAPRRTFASVLDRALDGVDAFRFSWFVCAGPWEQARHFAERFPASRQPTLPSARPLPGTPQDPQSIRVGCRVAEFKMQPDQPEQAVVLKDPAGEQTVLFDMVQGGAIVSLRYKGVEHIWGYNGGGLMQMAFHNGMSRGPWKGDYNPTQAGDGSSMSPVTGVACEGTSAINTLTMMLDFNHNNGFYEKPLIAVWGGRMNDMAPLSYFSPYTLETRARWVPNPAGEPKFYLRLEERFTHVADEVIGPFAYDFAAYMPWEFGVRAVSPENCPCPASPTSYVAGGWYRDDTRDTGLAVAMPGANFPGGQISGGFNSDYMWRNRNFHLGSSEALDGIASKSLVWYVMPGAWTNALSFAKSLGIAGK